MNVINNRYSSTLILTLLLFIGILVGSISADVENDDEQQKSKFTDSIFKSEKNTTLEQCRPGNHNIFWEDYLVVAIMLLVSCGIGVFYGFIGAEQTTSSDFLLGGSSMGTFPMAMSLAASFVTAIELLGNPAEVYLYGTQYWMICLAFVFSLPIASKLYLPVYMKLRLTSSYEYLSMRFNTKTRIIASVLYAVQMVLYTSVAVYAPALALTRVTGLNLYLSIVLIYGVCIFYASQGGMKAVIIADTFQAAILIGSILLIVYLGEIFVGGTGVVWSATYNSDRLEIFNFDPDPRVRNAFWPVVVGGTFYWMTMFCSNQASIQKYLSVETLGQARKALWVSCLGLILIFTINIYTGMILVAKYKDCDPILTGEILATDELLPLFVISVLGHFRGITGFFVAGIFAASLGTVASALNSLAAITCEDFLPNIFGIYMPPSKGALWAKWISVGYGALSFVLVFIVEQLGSVMQIAISFNGMVGGITLGLFSLGMFIPWANARGAIIGSAVAFVLVMWMGIGQQVSMAWGSFTIAQREISTSNCSCIVANSSLSMNAEPQNEDVLFLYRVSFLWYSAIGFMVTLIVGYVSSYIFGLENPEDVNPDLISPPIYNMLHSLPNNLKEWLNIPLKVKNKSNDNGIQLKGIVNVNIDLSDEMLPKIEDKDKEYNEKSLL